MNIKKRTCKIVDLAIPADDRVKLKGNEKNYKYLDLAREVKKTMEHKVLLVHSLIDTRLIHGLKDLEIRG